MYFQQYYLSCLAHASYLIGSEGQAAVVDPQRDVQIYLDDAKKHGLAITHVIETHMHADFVSGHKELAARTGAKIYVGQKAGAHFEHVAVKDGEEARMGNILFRFLETPGHSIDSICIAAFDLEGKNSPGEPWGVFTGDTLFIGEVGRPDLSPTHTPHELANLLYDSLHKLLALPDSCQVFPAHGAGSLCGRNISDEKHSTIGRERAFNYALQPRSREDFVALITADFPERPDYFLRDAQINRVGAPLLTELPPVATLTPQQVLHKQETGCVVLDTRSAAEFGAGHVPGSIHIGLGGQFAAWTGSLIGLDVPIILVVSDPDKLQESQVRLARVGIENLAGYLGTSGNAPTGSDVGPEASGQAILAWQRAGLPLGQVPQISVLNLHQELSDRPNELQVVDVRRATEWEAGHVEQARLKSLSDLRTMLHDLDTQRPIAVHCKSGYRSSIATSLLLRAGFKQVMNVTGGFDAWTAQKLPVVVEKSAGACPA
ncbi:MAG: rhodanese-like domain-containing protein [Acidobacteria bacterium]|nr:rhodanese-like domain-containing protein [Acidobacteriota bacterium]MCL5289378.1 rhodanese-like domain-containing protein [Acidobacteriota bacterium]